MSRLMKWMQPGSLRSQATTNDASGGLAVRSVRRRFAGCLTLLLLGVACLVQGPRITLGQDADGAAQNEAQQVAAEAPPEAAPNPAAPVEASKDQKAVAPPQTALAFFFESLGWRYTIAFLILSMSLVAMVISAFMAARRESMVPAALVDGFEQLLNDKKYQEAYDLAKGDDSFLGRVLAAGMARLSSGFPQAQEAMQEMGEEETMKIEHRLSYLALIGGLSPMVGLLGTVDGMVTAFSLIASSNTAPAPAELAKGICTALITTLVGLWLAIPAIGLHNYFKNRFQRLALEVSLASGQILGRFENVPVRK